MRSVPYKNIVINSLSIFLGFGIGWACFCSPAWACGYFRSEIAAAWFGVLGAFIAALATIWAVLASLRTSREAISAEYAIRQSEIDLEVLKIDSMRHRLSVIFRAELYILSADLFYVTRHLNESMEIRDWREVQRTLLEDIPKEGLTLLLKFSNDLYAFPPEVGGHLAYALWRWIAIKQGPDPKFPTTQRTHDNVVAFLRACDIAIEDFRIAFNSLQSFVPRDNPMGEDEVHFSKRSGIWSIG